MSQNILRIPICSSGCKLFPAKFCYILFFKSLRVCRDTIRADDIKTRGLIGVNRFFVLGTTDVSVFVLGFFVDLIFSSGLKLSEVLFIKNFPSQSSKPSKLSPFT